jgi:hypothetical protein
MVTWGLGIIHMRRLLISILLLPVLAHAKPKPDIDDVKNMYDRRWSTTYLGISGTANNKLIIPTRTNLSIKHHSSWVYGYNDFYMNVVNPTQSNHLIYGSYRPSLSLVRSSGLFTNEYPMLDLALAMQMSWTELNERVFDMGFDFHLAPPNTWHYLIIGAYARKNFDHPGGTYSIQLRSKLTVARGLLFKLNVDGTPKDQGTSLKANLMVQTELLLDIGKVWNRANQVYFGPTFKYWANKLGRSGVNEASYGVELLISL